MSQRGTYLSGARSCGIAYFTKPFRLFGPNGTPKFFRTMCPRFRRLLIKFYLSCSLRCPNNTCLPTVNLWTLCSIGTPWCLVSPLYLFQLFSAIKFYLTNKKREDEGNV